jgi:peptidoglycan hydrolase CwlO-like protein
MKRWIFSVVAVVSTAIVIFGFNTVVSYVNTSRHVVNRDLQDAVSLTFHLERLRQMVNSLVPEVDRNRLVVAESEVDLERLQQDLVAHKNHLAQAEKQILQQRELLRGEGQIFCIGGRRFTRAQVLEDLERRLGEFTSAEESIATQERLLEARQKAVDAARSKLGSYQRQRQKLESDVAQLDAQMKLIESTSGTTQVNFDQSRMAEVKDLACYIKRKLDITQRAIEGTNWANQGLPIEEQPTRDVVSEVDRRFHIPNIKSDHKMATRINPCP